HIDDIIQLLDRLERGVIALIPLDLIEDDEASGALIQHADDDAIEDHLRELPLHLL
ncbi:hypothetical protein LTR28_001338, partial [Elasticomyces elasticus]